MSDLKVCRICLRTQCKVYKYDRFQLKPYYEEVMALKVNDNDGLPHYFCYECATMLHKFHKFKEKCYRGQNTLKEISWRQSITYEAVYKIDRGLCLLKSPLEILTVSDRVKTFVTTDTAELSESETESLCAEDEKEINLKDIEPPQVFLEEPTIADDDSDENFDSDKGPDNEGTKYIDEVEGNKDENINNTAENTEKTDTLDKIEDDIEIDNEATSPTTVFVDVKKDMIMLTNEPIKERKNSVPDFGLKKPNPKYAKQRVKFLDSKSWKKYTLSEEDAVKEFQMRAQSSKYLKAPYQCTDCLKGFSKEDMLKRHRTLRHNESLGSLECRFCRMRFKWDCQLRKHMRQHFTRYHCLLCDLRCSLENTALLHEEVHKGIIKTCVHCGEQFKHSSTYYTHLRTHRSAYICTLCGMSFVSNMGLHMHKKIKHVTNEIESPDDDEEVNTFCDKCDIRFETRKAYEEHLFHSALHIDGVDDGKDNRETEDLSRKILGRKLKLKITTSLKRKKSEVDLYGTPKKPTRKSGRRNYKKPTTCHQCGKHFDTQAACMKHHLAEHPKTSFFAPAERHICEICGASLAPGSVAMHQNIHSREKVHPCETCGKTFHSSMGLRRHLVTHTGEKPFACSLCDKRFTQSNSMKLHYKTFHLKQPYPKRNRRKKKDEPPEMSSADKSSSEDSDTSLPEQRLPARGIEPATTAGHESMQYLTLS